jgi:hypothetical protein
MNHIINPKKLNMMPIVSHIKVPSFELNAQGKEILKAKKLALNFSHPKPRSLSAQTNIKNLFKIPRNKKQESKENNLTSDSPSNAGFIIDKNIENRSKKTQNFMEIKYLGEICHQIAKDSHILKSKIEEQEKVDKSCSFDRNNGFIKHLPHSSIQRVTPLRLPAKPGQLFQEKNEELVTFRPNYTPKKQFHFPREVFSKKLK